MNRQSMVKAAATACLLAGTWSGSGLAEDLAKVGAAPVLEDRYPERRIPFPGGVVSLPDLVFSTVPGFRPLRLDLYMQAGAEQGPPKPLIIYIHGGGWVGGHTRHAGAFEDWPGVLAQLAARGFVVASIEYRLSGEAPFPAAGHDVKTAIRWLRGQAATYGIDKQKVFVWGGSAGGQLAALAATSCGVTALDPPGIAGKSGVESDCVQGAVVWYGIFDFEQLGQRNVAGRPPSADARYLGCATGICAPDVARAAGAISYLDRNDPPMLLIHGVDDRTVPVAQSELMAGRLKAAGVRTDLLLIPDVDHSFIGKTPEATRAASLLALERTFAFFEQL